jgi:hypothetical protein
VTMRLSQGKRTYSTSVSTRHAESTTTVRVSYRAVPPCPVEDADNCRWDARTSGNGRGRSYVHFVLAGQSMLMYDNGQTLVG